MTSLASDHALCAEVLRRSGSNFAGPIRLLPAGKRAGTTALYAFCRRADDIVDDCEDTELAAADLDAFRDQLRAAIDGAAVDDPILRAVADTVRRFAVPESCLHDILDGVRMDLDHRGFETFPDLEEYCRRVASAVGIAAIHVWGFLTPAALPAAHACGLGFQLTNILRDIVEDRARGRLYLAREDLRACGCVVKDIAEGSCDPSRARLASLYVGRAADCFRSAAALDHMLTTDGRVVFRAMFGAYRALFEAVRRAGDEIFVRRVRPPRAALLASTCAAILLGPRP